MWSIVLLLFFWKLMCWLISSSVMLFPVSWSWPIWSNLLCSDRNMMKVQMSTLSTMSVTTHSVEEEQTDCFQPVTQTVCSSFVSRSLTRSSRLLLMEELVILPLEEQNLQSKSFSLHVFLFMYPVCRAEWNSGAKLQTYWAANGVWLFLFCAVVRKYTENKLSSEMQSVVSNAAVWGPVRAALHCLYWTESVRQFVLLRVLKIGVWNNNVLHFQWLCCYS